MVLEITEQTFEEEVTKSDLPTVVDFWAPWCGPCKMVTPILQRIHEKAGDRVKIVKLNVDENPITAGKFSITAIPTVMLFKNGALEKQFVGVQPESVYLEAIEL